MNGEKSDDEFLEREMKTWIGVILPSSSPSSSSSSGPLLRTGVVSSCPIVLPLFFGQDGGEGQHGGMKRDSEGLEILLKKLAKRMEGLKSSVEVASRLPTAGQFLAVLLSSNEILSSTCIEILMDCFVQLFLLSTSNFTLTTSSSTEAEREKEKRIIEKAEIFSLHGLMKTFFDGFLRNHAGDLRLLSLLGHSQPEITEALRLQITTTLSSLFKRDPASGSSLVSSGQREKVSNVLSFLSSHTSLFSPDYVSLLESYILHSFDKEKPSQRQRVIHSLLRNPSLYGSLSTASKTVLWRSDSSLLFSHLFSLLELLSTHRPLMGRDAFLLEPTATSLLHSFSQEPILLSESIQLLVDSMLSSSSSSSPSSLRLQAVGRRLISYINAADLPTPSYLQISTPLRQLRGFLQQRTSWHVLKNISSQLQSYTETSSSVEGGDVNLKQRLIWTLLVQYSHHYRFALLLFLQELQEKRKTTKRRRKEEEEEGEERLLTASELVSWCWFPSLGILKRKEMIIGLGEITQELSNLFTKEGEEKMEKTLQTLVQRSRTNPLLPLLLLSDMIQVSLVLNPQLISPLFERKQRFNNKKRKRSTGENEEEGSSMEVLIDSKDWPSTLLDFLDDWVDNPNIQKTTASLTLEHVTRTYVYLAKSRHPDLMRRCKSFLKRIKVTPETQSLVTGSLIELDSIVIID